jgi:hypothetical protein
MTNGQAIASKLPGVCCICLFLLGCESDVERYKPEPNVHCLLRTNRSTVTLLAGMTLGYYDSIPDTNQWQGTSGVAVSIGHRGEVTALSEMADSAGYYRTDSLSIVPGDSYSLSVVYPGGTRVAGSTVIPGGFGFDSLRVDTTFEIPWPGDTYARIKVDYHWGKSRGADVYMEQMDIWYKSGEDSSLQRNGPISTSAYRDSWTFDPVCYFWDTLSGGVDSLPLDHVRIEIKALDRNYSDYAFSLDYMGGVDPDKMHLEGGVGVFGSACIVDSTIWFRPPVWKSAHGSRSGSSGLRLNRKEQHR